MIPKHHSAQLHDIPTDQLSDILPTIHRIASKAFGEAGVAYNILQNNGKLAHQEVGHVHFHIIPRRGQEEGLQIRWQPKTMTPQQLAAFASSLKEKLAD